MITASLPANVARSHATLAAAETGQQRPRLPLARQVAAEHVGRNGELRARQVAETLSFGLGRTAFDGFHRNVHSLSAARQGNGGLVAARLRLAPVNAYEDAPLVGRAGE